MNSDSDNRPEIDNANLLWDIRIVQPSDIAFIYSSWLKSYKHSSSFGKSLRTSTFYENYREILDNILYNSVTVIACSKEDPKVILGYLVYEPSYGYHYVFVKHAFRRLGIATSLTTRSIPYNQFSHLTSDGTAFAKSLSHSLDYNPFRLYRRGDDD